jgi:hypothetical protein
MPGSERQMESKAREEIMSAGKYIHKGIKGGKAVVVLKESENG